MMLRKLLRSLAARPYATKLPRALAKGWGRSQHYSSGQIASAAKQLRLNPRHLAFGYALFLPREQYEAVSPPARLAYDDARQAALVWLAGSGADRWDATSGGGEFATGDGFYGDIGHGGHGGDGGGH
jgi:hypothetical protein